MKCLRLIVKQKSAHYRKVETVKNKMTYQLPPFSTVIGALHSACGYKEYMPMNISVQGEYHNMKLDHKIEYIRLNSINYTDSRGKLVKLFNQNILTGKEQVIAEATQARSASYVKKTGIKIHNESELDTFIDFYNKKDKKSLKNYAELVKQQTHIETLYDVKLIIHISVDDAILNDIKNNIYNLTAIGRSQDFIDLISCDFVDVEKTTKEMYSKYLIYCPKNLIKNKSVYKKTSEDKIPALGTCYHIDKNYKIVDNKRVFDKVNVCVISDFYSDTVETDGEYIVLFS